jgi:hypothetical protein
MPKHPFHVPRRKILRAKEHTRNMESRIRRFFDSEPYTYIREVNAQRTHELHKVRFKKQIPERAGELAVEAAEALRSALDQAAFAVAAAANPTRPRSSIKCAYFPIADSAAQLMTDVINRGRCKDLPPDIVTFLCALKPHKGGNDLIWAVNKLANANKHAGILDPVAGTIGTIYFRNATFSSGTEFYSNWDPEKNEIEFAALPVGRHAQYDGDVSLGVTFGEIEAVRGRPPDVFLNAAIIEFDRIIDAIEAETKRLGIIK